VCDDGTTIDEVFNDRPTEYEGSITMTDDLVCTLTMNDSYGDGWNGGVLTIGSVGFEAANAGAGSVASASTEDVMFFAG
jgi:hypothetical protein